MAERVPNTKESSEQIEMRRPAREEKRRAPGGDRVARSMCVEWTLLPEGRRVAKRRRSDNRAPITEEDEDLTGEPRTARRALSGQEDSQ